MSKLKVNQIETINNQPLKIVGDVLVNNIIALSGTNGSTSATTVSDFWVDSLSTSKESLNVKNNLDVNGSISGTFIYGDGSKLSNLSLGVKKSVGNDSLIQDNPSNSISFGDNTTSFGVGVSSNGDFSNSFGSGNLTGSKSHNTNNIINGKYLLILGDVSDDFVIGNLRTKPNINKIVTGITISTGTTISVDYGTITGTSVNGCGYYALANNTASNMTFTYTDCQTGLTAQTTTNSYNISYVCSLTTPTWVNYPWLNSYPFPAVVTLLGNCCDDTQITTAITTTVVTSTNVQYIPRPYSGDCKSFYIQNNTYPYTVDIWYTSCTGNASFFILSDPSATLCAKGVATTWGPNGPSVGTAYTVTQISNQCCTNYNIFNPAFCTIVVNYTDCYTGLPLSGFVYGYSTSPICSSTYPTFNIPCISAYTTNAYYPQVTISSSTGRCEQYTIVTSTTVVSSSTTITITSGCTNDIIYTSGLTGCINYITQNNSPINANIYFTDCFGHYRSIEVISGTSTNFCSSNYPLIGVSSAYTSNIVITPSGNCETLCVRYAFIKNSSTTIPAIWDVRYLDCDFNEQTFRFKNVGDVLEVCAILGSVTHGTNITVYQGGSCTQQSNRTRSLIEKTSCRNYYLNNNTASNITFSYTDCQTGLSAQTSVGFYGTTNVCSLTTPTYVTYPWMSAYTNPVLVTQSGTCRSNVVTISGLTLVNGTVYNGTVKQPVNIVNLITGTTGTYFTGVTGVTVFLSGLTGSSKFTLIELSEELPIDFYSAEIVSNYFGTSALASGIETQAKGTASNSRNMLTKALGDYSNAEGYNTETNGKASQSGGIDSKSEYTGEFVRSSGSFNTKGDSQYSILNARGITNGVESIDLSFNSEGIEETLKIYKDSVVTIGIDLQCVIAKGNYVPNYSSWSNKKYTMVCSSYDGEISIADDPFKTPLNPDFWSNSDLYGTMFELTQGDKYDDYTELKIKVYGVNDGSSNPLLLYWNSMITILQTKITGNY